MMLNVLNSLKYYWETQRDLTASPAWMWNAGSILTQHPNVYDTWLEYKDTVDRLSRVLESAIVLETNESSQGDEW